ncbi:hypothetical protein R0137_16775 [Congregibacter brevis]|uniref:Uncharacterized protein n=1 Tax=Congregibacter brevis TaxID=3081201 RepID=A0ABZ0IBI5_9GAMM|nr:hypothetical protein R0137_16775 [Congregibacter sp. IMCC45268]
MKKLLLSLLLVAIGALCVWTFREYQPLAGQVSATDTPFGPESAMTEMIAELDYGVLPEASGLAVSGVDSRRLWLINDSGGRSELVALGLDDNRFLRVNVLDTPNRDWEDLETFDYKGTPWILVADVGDNAARRQYVSLYFFPEPSVEDTEVKVQTTIELSYPGGPRDVESVAVDPRTNTLYLLSKREALPKLFALTLPALDKAEAYQLQATLVGEVRSIPAPTVEELQRFSKYGKFRSQPTGMAHVPDGSGIALLTYGNTYFAALNEERDWLAALNESLCPVPRPELKQAESIAADTQGRFYVTSEGRSAPVLRVSVGDCRTEQ